MSVQNITPDGVSLPRSQPPAISGNFLSRKHLFPLFESHVPGATLVIAPAGFGKTTLVAEWVQESSRPTFWYTVDAADSIKDFQAHVVAAVSANFPDFFEGISELEHIDPREGIKLLGAAVSKLSGEFNFVIDSGHVENHEIAPYYQLIADSIPNNSHLIIIRRSSPLSNLSRYATLGNLSFITSEELKFSSNEVETIANINDVDLSAKTNMKEILLCQGWPAAVQLMCRNISKGNSHTTFSEAVASNTNPLGILALETYNTFSESTRSKILKLSMIEEFDEEVAEIILGESFSLAFLNRIASDGVFVTASTTVNRTYRFNSIIFEALSQIPQVSTDATKFTARELTDLFMARGDYSSALNFASKSGDQARFGEIFRTSLRQMAATGRGDLLIKWSHFAGDESVHGEIMRKSIKIIGHLVNSDFLNAESLTLELEHIAGVGPDAEFLNRLAAKAKSHIYFARGDFERSAKYLEVALTPISSAHSFDATDAVAMLRLQARQAFLFDDFDQLSKAYESAAALPNEGDKAQIAFHLTCMKSMVFYAEGRYIQAAEISRIAITQGRESGYVGITGPLDAMMVLARTQLESSDLENCIETLELIMEQSKDWEIWPWFVMAEGTITRIQISKGNLGKASESITRQRAFLETLRAPHQLNWIVDMSELFLRLNAGDWHRCEELITRMPQIQLVKQVSASIAHNKDSKRTAKLIEAMPVNTVREEINKWLSEASLNLDNEQLAMKSLGRALALGAENGYHEYFVRQTEMYPLIVKIAALRPTFYMEGLVRAMMQRINATNNLQGELDEKLTMRELEILKHLTTGNPISVIAKTLYISQNTMKTHLRNTYRKLGVDGRYSAVEKAKKLLLI